MSPSQLYLVIGKTEALFSSYLLKHTTVLCLTDNVLFIDLGANYMVYSVCRVYSELNMTGVLL